MFSGGVVPPLTLPYTAQVVSYPGYQSLYDVARSVGCEVSLWEVQLEGEWGPAFDVGDLKVGRVCNVIPGWVQWHYGMRARCRASLLPGLPCTSVRGALHLSLAVLSASASTVRQQLIDRTRFRPTIHHPFLFPSTLRYPYASPPPW